MRVFRMLLMLPMALAAQTTPAAGLVSGTLLERDPQTVAGQFSIRVADNQVLRYRFDGKTQVERDRQSIDVSRLQPGETVEVLSDEAPGPVLRYARTVEVLTEPAPARALPLGLRADRKPAERAMPMGTLTFSGVVFELNSGRVIIHTRESGNQSILLRGDTRYLENGDVVQAGDLKPNMRVFVRAGKTLYNELEAYQVIWGQILTPR